MKVQTRNQPTASKLSLLRQLCNLIPQHLVSQLARATGNEAHARTCSPWSHVVSLLYAQVTHSLGLNDVCYALRLRSGPLSAIRGAPPPSKNGLSQANRNRDPRLAEQLFWKRLAHLQSLAPALPRRTAPRHRPGRGGRRTPRTGFPDQQRHLERPDRRRPLPLEQRSVFQRTQTDLAAGRLPRPQRQRGALASVDGLAGLSVVALRRLPQPMGAQPPPPLCPDPFGPVAKTGTGQPPRMRWDSQWRRALSRHPAASLFAGLRLILWDSPSS